MTDLTASVHYDPHDDALAADPYPTYRRLRERYPVYRDPGGRFWALSRFDDVAAAFADPGRFTSRFGVAYEGSGDVPSLLEMDPPVHTGYRRVVAGFFTPRKVAELGGTARRLAAAVLADLGPRFDLVPDFAARIPVALAARILGADAASIPALTRGIDQVLTGDDETAGAAMAGLDAFARELLADRRRRPAGDLASALTRAAIAGRPLSVADQVMICQMVLLGGQEPVSTLIGAAACLIDAERRAGRGPAAGAPLPDGLVDEVARLVSPTQYMLRTTTRDVPIGGRTIPEGAQVVLLIAAANRDPERFPEPDEFRCSRPAGRSLAFGRGPHACLGQWLGRLAVRAAVEELYRLRPHFEIDHDKVEWRRSGNVRQLYAAPGGE